MSQNGAWVSRGWTRRRHPSAGHEWEFEGFCVVTVDWSPASFDSRRESSSAVSGEPEMLVGLRIDDASEVLAGCSVGGARDGGVAVMFLRQLDAALVDAAGVGSDGLTVLDGVVLPVLAHHLRVPRDLGHRASVEGAARSAGPDFGRVPHGSIVERLSARHRVGERDDGTSQRGNRAARR